jgi:hypothetical protein
MANDQLVQPPPLPQRDNNEALGKAWSYFAKGAVVGPLDEDRLLFAAERGEIDLDTLAYTAEFGPDTPENWKQLGATELADKVSKVLDISDTLARDVVDVASTTLSRNIADVASSTLSPDVLDIASEPQQDNDNHEPLVEPPSIPQQDNDYRETGRWYFAETPNPLMREIQKKRWLRGIGLGIILLFIVIGILSSPPNAPHNSTPPSTQGYGSPSTREGVASYAQQMASAMNVIGEGSSELTCYDLAVCGRSLDRFVSNVEDARQKIAVARANEPSCMTEVGAATSAFVNRYYHDILNARASVRTGDVAGAIANAQKAAADVSDSVDVKAAMERAHITCQASYNNGEDPQPQTMPEKIRAAVAAQYSCTPSLSDIRFTASDSTGAGYVTGCGRWLYWVSIDPQGQIKVTRAFEWNGR